MCFCCVQFLCHLLFWVHMLYFYFDLGCHLSIPVQPIAWKDSSPIIFWVGRKLNTMHSDWSLNSSTAEEGTDFAVTVCCWCCYQLALIRLLLQACANYGLPTDVAELIENISRQCDGWMAYKIGRQAARFGHHFLATGIFAQLTLAVSSLLINLAQRSLRVNVSL